MTEIKFRNLGIWDVLEKSEFWKMFAEKVNAEFKIITTVSRDLNRLELKSEYKKIVISFSESDTKPLFVSCEFRQNRNLTWFEISKSDFIEKIINKFSRNSIKSINGDFNKNYISKTIDNYKIKSIINNKTITDLILKQNLTFIGGKQEKNGVFTLSLNIHRNVNNLQHLKAVYDLTLKLIDELI
ncbi:MAG: hypothetical protein K9J13_00020 [Saprospiraceae bacterium]|nr:hypothetical protein [Saprospiraceae bacterium]